MTKQEQTWSVRTKLLLYILPVFRCNNITLLVLSHNSQQQQPASTATPLSTNLVRLEYCVVYRIYLRLLNKQYTKASRMTMMPITPIPPMTLPTIVPTGLAVVGMEGDPIVILMFASALRKETISSRMNGCVSFAIATVIKSV